MNHLPESVRERIWRQVDVGEPNECWLWLGKVTHQGYSVGGARIDGRTISQAYRVVFYDEHGWLPGRWDGKSIDHICSNPTCVNPRHLRAVPHRQNIMRSPTQPCAINARKTHCPKGHPYAGKNLYVKPSGDRQCRECARTRTRLWYQTHGDPRRKKRAA